MLPWGWVDRPQTREHWPNILQGIFGSVSLDLPLAGGNCSCLVVMWKDLEGGDDGVLELCHKGIESQGDAEVGLHIPMSISSGGA
jgi:hypothetical protein